MVDGASFSGESHLIQFPCALGCFKSQRLTCTLHSLVRVSRRGDFEHFVRVFTERHGKPADAPFRINSSIQPQTRHRESYNIDCSTTFSLALLPESNPHELGMRPASPGRKYRATDLPHTAQKRLPSKQFQVLLTPSSGFFSSFPHGTCSLSVSRPYLALDGTYHPLRAAIPNNSTLRTFVRTTRQQEKYEAITHSGGPFQEHFLSSLWLHKHLQTTILFFREISSLSFSLFTRSYLGNHCYFLFLGLIRCFSPAGSLP